ASQISCGGPPDASTLFTLPPATNAMERLSADQKGCAAPSVPGRRCGVTAPTGRQKKNKMFSEFPNFFWRATNASVRPSGEIAKFDGLKTPTPETPWYPAAAPTLFPLPPA